MVTRLNTLAAVTSCSARRGNQALTGRGEHPNPAARSSRLAARVVRPRGSENKLEKSRAKQPNKHLAAQSEGQPSFDWRRRAPQCSRTKG
eukprot:6191567-Amphidinium_carterae.2